MKKQFKLDWPWNTPEPGIYFDMPFDEYLSIPCLSASGCKDILMSESNFWFNSWLNEYKNVENSSSPAQIIGTAYHTRLLDGEDEFYSQYATEFEKPKNKNILSTQSDMIKFLKSKDVKGYSGKSAYDTAMMCIKADPKAIVLPILKREHEDQNKNKIMLDAQTMRNIEYSAQMVEHHPELKTYFAGGYPEVTIIWDDPVYKTRFKTRIDYLKISPVCDLKTFANLMRKDISKAITNAIADHKYYIQAWLYLRAMPFAKKFVLDGKITSKKKIDPEWLKLFAQTPSNEFWYVFIQKGNAPVARGAKLVLRDESFDKAGRICIENATDRFKQSYSVFGNDPWVDLTPSETISMDSLPPWAFDI